jgi:CRP/FNR family cyclic AMP-dependent transcriptional regulator
MFVVLSWRFVESVSVTPSYIARSMLGSFEELQSIECELRMMISVVSGISVKRVTMTRLGRFDPVTVTRFSRSLARVRESCQNAAMQDVLELCQGLETVTFDTGDVLFPEGGKTGLLYILISGGVDVIKGETPITTIREPGAIFGEISLLLDGPHPASVEVIEPTTCHVIRGGKDYLTSNPGLTLAVAELLAARLKGMIAYLADMKAQYADRKDHLGMVDELLLDLAHRIPKR